MKTMECSKTIHFGRHPRKGFMASLDIFKGSSPLEIIYTVEFDLQEAADHDGYLFSESHTYISCALHDVLTTSSWKLQDDIIRKFIKTMVYESQAHDIQPDLEISDLT
jgi:hypothetical protein